MSSLCGVRGELRSFCKAIQQQGADYVFLSETYMERVFVPKTVNNVPLKPSSFATFRRGICQNLLRKTATLANLASHLSGICPLSQEERHWRFYLLWKYFSLLYPFSLNRSAAQSFNLIMPNSLQKMSYTKYPFMLGLHSDDSI